jgi:hypothetical protein
MGIRFVDGTRSRHDATARGGTWNATLWMRRKELFANGLLVRGRTPCSIGSEDCGAESVAACSSHRDYMPPRVPGMFVEVVLEGGRLQVAVGGNKGRPCGRTKQEAREAAMRFTLCRRPIQAGGCAEAAVNLPRIPLPRLLLRSSSTSLQRMVREMVVLSTSS